MVDFGWLFFNIEMELAESLYIIVGAKNSELKATKVENFVKQNSDDETVKIKKP